MKKYNEMTVVELRQELKNRGLSTCEKGNKLPKAGLIARLEENDKQNKGAEKMENKKVDVEVETKGDATEPKWFVDSEWTDEKVTDPNVLAEQGWENEASEKEEPEKKADLYYKEKPQKIYDDLFKVGNFVAFMDVMDINRPGKPHVIVRKMRSAMIVAVHRKRRLLRLETKLGTKYEISFDEVFWCKEEGKRFPSWIHKRLRAKAEWEQVKD